MFFATKTALCVVLLFFWELLVKRSNKKLYCFFETMTVWKLCVRVLVSENFTCVHATWSWLFFERMVACVSQYSFLTTSLYKELTWSWTFFEVTVLFPENFVHTEVTLRWTVFWDLDGLKTLCRSTRFWKLLVQKSNPKLNYFFLKHWKLYVVRCSTRFWEHLIYRVENWSKEFFFFCERGFY